jgi:hypothetical protein
VGGGRGIKNGYSDARQEEKSKYLLLYKKKEEEEAFHAT